MSRFSPPILVVVSAPSGAGKTTLCQRLLADFPELVLSISSTTRSPRGAEVDGKDYFFLTVPAFEAQIEGGFFAEWARVHGNYYGTSREVIQAAFARGKSVLLDIDVQGAASLNTAYPGRCLQVFIAPPSLEELEMRLRNRGTESDSSIQHRMNNARIEMKESEKFDAIIINDRLDRAYQELNTLVTHVLRGKPH
jgi:guanylate kinase